jgi:hypothetical protein
MSIDNHYIKVDGRWARIEPHVGNGPNFATEFWVDICHGGNCVIDERYYFEDLASALAFYLGGWSECEMVGDDGKPLGLSHSGLYSRGHLIHGRSIHGDAPGHEGENLLRIVDEELARTLDRNV